MIERKFVSERLKEFQIQEYMSSQLKGVGQSRIKLQRTPLGEKVIIYASRPGLIVGRGGENIRRLTRDLKKKFGLENPQIEISEVENINLDANIVAERIASSLERFGSSKFKGVGHKTMENVMNAGALGVEILISGKIPGSRAKRWRFYQGYLKKCGDIALTGILKSYKTAHLKTGAIGIQVRIMPPDIVLPDNITKREEIKEDKEAEKSEEESKSTDEIKEAKTEENTKSEEEKPAKKKTKKSKDKDDTEEIAEDKTKKPEEDIEKVEKSEEESKSTDEIKEAKTEENTKSEEEIDESKKSNELKEENKDGTDK